MRMTKYDSDFEFKLNRKSLNNHLYKGEFENCVEKISDNLDLININVNDLRVYSEDKIKKSKKRLSVEFVEKGNKIIYKTTKLFEQTFLLIKDFQEFKGFQGFGTKLKYLKLLNNFEQRTLKLEEKFNDYCNNLRKENEKMVNETRISILNSRRETFTSGGDSSSNMENKPNLTAEEIQKFNQQIDLQINKLEQPNNKLKFIADLDDSLIEIRLKQIDFIKGEINTMNKLSKKMAEIVEESGKKVNTIEENIESVLVNTKGAQNNIKEAESVQRENSSGGIFDTNKILLYLTIFVGVLFVIAASK
jgi:hypothetical protein